MINISPDQVINLILQGYDGSQVLSLQEVESIVDTFLTGVFEQFKPHRQSIIDEILRRVNIKIGIAAALDGDQQDHVEWLNDEAKASWVIWPRLESYFLTREKMPPTVVKELGRSTDKVLERLESPKRAGKWDRRGLVVGSVQSGKTTHYTSLAAKALDSGYQIVIILAGIHNNLRSQTHERIDKHLIGKDSAAMLQAHRLGENMGAAVSPIGIGLFAQELGYDPLPYTVITCTSSDENGDFQTPTAQRVGFEVSDGTRLVMVVKKHGTILKNLIKWLRTQNTNTAVSNAKIKAPTLIIDDEADHAGINTTKDANANPTMINRRIRQLASSFERVGFVGYTATPFANIFIKPDDADTPERIIDGIPLGKDLFPESFIISLKPPSNYIGPNLVFGHSGDEAVGLAGKKPLPMYVKIADSGDWVPDRHKPQHPPGAVPDSLREAIKLFALVCAVRAVRGDSKKHNSMLVHATRYIDVQDKISIQISTELEILQNLVLHASPAKRQSISEELMEIYFNRLVAPHEEFRLRLNDTLPIPEWKDIWEALPDTLDKISVMKIHGKSEEALEYSRRKDGVSIIVVGGDKLSRGLTLEGLSISYFLRASNMFDTLLQMGRWFGYRPGYADLCRVYTTKSLYSAFEEIALATTELQEELESMASSGKTPKDYGLKVRTPSDRLLITAANKIRSGKPVAVQFAGECVQALEVYYNAPKAQKNETAIKELIINLGIKGKRQDALNNYKWEEVEVQTVLDFLQEYEAISTPSFYNNCDPLRRYITDQVGKGELVNWTVALVSKSKQSEGGTCFIDGEEIKLVSRGIVDELGATVKFRAVVSGDDERADFTEPANSSSANLSDPDLNAGGIVRTSSKREAVRKARPQSRGLLLLYLIEGTQISKETENKEVVTPEGKFIPSIAVSFPYSSTARALEYTVNEVWRKNYGLVEEETDA